MQIWDQEQQLLMASTQEPPNPRTIYPAWHDRRVHLGLASAQETWSDLLEHTMPGHAELEQALIAHKIV
ncbi:hypothetical protein [Dictyobacter arantiisoli]|uniref:Uncharacterized protein n=1 Tax=Dictyobacter arantiisoli TaxID=2014874 RepID=A0A5A5TJL0_9CHLR|nr:hypothetical protein [Dictyobacter arantiisoli]GCF11418.1 hypothetical protein KDI_49820 [Dictyobacter arantiisoli]